MKECFKTLASLAGVLAITGCSTVQDYPRCYLFRTPSDAEILAANSRDTRLFEQAFMVKDVVPRRDEVIVTASLNVHQNIEDVWATIGCVNLRRQDPFNAETIDKWIIARCQEYMNEYVEALNESSPQQESETLTEIAAKYDEFVCH